MPTPDIRGRFICDCRAGQTAPLAQSHPMGPALGLFADSKYLSDECTLAPGDMLLLFTDGLFEVTDVEGEK